MSKVLGKIISGPSSLELGVIQAWLNGSNQEAEFVLLIEKGAKRTLRIQPVLKALTLLNRQKELWRIDAKLRYQQAEHGSLFAQDETALGLDHDFPVEIFYFGNKRTGELLKRLKLDESDVHEIAAMLDAREYEQYRIYKDVPKPSGLEGYCNNQLPRRDKEGEFFGCGTNYDACKRWVKQNPDHALTWQKFAELFTSRKA
jgi:hypothetical protein